MFCPSCGEEIRSGSVYCPYCSASVHNIPDNTWTRDKPVRLLAKCSLTLAKGFTAVLIGGLASASGLAAASSLVLACCLIYYFAKGMVVMVPWYMDSTLPISSVGGILLLFSGLTGLLIALLLGMASGSLFHCLKMSFAKHTHGVKTI